MKRIIYCVIIFFDFLFSLYIDLNSASRLLPDSDYKHFDSRQKSHRRSKSRYRRLLDTETISIRAVEDIACFREFWLTIALLVMFVLLKN